MVQNMCKAWYLQNKRDGIDGTDDDKQPHMQICGGNSEMQEIYKRPQRTACSQKFF